MEKEKGIFIPIEIWTIKNLNINEKLILSDIYQKRKLENFEGYNKKSTTLFEELGILEKQAKETYKILNKKGYIFSNPTYLRTRGEIKKVLANRDINMETLRNAERFIIPENNIFYKDSKQGVFILFDDIIKINSYGFTREEKRYKAKNRDRFLILYLLIVKKAFFMPQYFNTGINPLFVRFKIKDLTEFTGWSYKTIFDHIKSLASTLTYNKISYKLLYNLGKLEDYELIYNKFNIKPFQKWNGKEVTIYDSWGNSEEINKETDRTMYFIDTQSLAEIGMLFNLDNKFNKAVEKI